MVELKVIIPNVTQPPRTRFNRSMVELKVGRYSWLTVVTLGFNRSMVELKVDALILSITPDA